ncbi:hypothetical protein, partial [Streptomyces calidiresistens]|uniref:hypothetical protein n=1 Tax=Streptomyces calidiresistens TaxID=1485586 RepID=UPI0015FB250E
LAPGAEVETVWADASGSTVPLTVSLVEVTPGDGEGGDGERTPHLVTMEYRYEGDRDLSPDPGTGLELWTATGTMAMPLSADGTEDGEPAEGTPSGCPDIAPNEMSEADGTSSPAVGCTVHPTPEGEVPAVVYFTSNADVGGPHGWLIEPAG